MNLIFLDIDGVLNNSLHPVQSAYHVGLEFDPNCIDYLKEIIRKTDSSLVISSTWRIGRTVESLNNDVLQYYGLDTYVVGFTPVFHEQIRGNEIKHFLDNTNLEFNNFIIIDDDNDMGELLPRLVRTNARRGLDKFTKSKAIKLMMSSHYTVTGGK